VVSSTTDTAARLRRLLAVLAWLAQVGEASIDEVASRFDLTPEALVTELEMAACCGVPPYTPDQLMEIIVTDHTVSTRVGTALTRPRRLSPSEGFALAASARALLAVEGSADNNALTGALAKLERALGGEAVEVELDTPEFLPLVRDALRTSSRLSVSYYSASTDRVTDRVIAPTRVFAADGRWYVDAWCSSAGDLRRFRVDRINAASPVDGEGGAPVATADGALPDGRGPAEAGDAPSGDGGDGGPEPDTAPGATGFEPFVPGPDGRTVRLSLDPSSTWMVESIPTAGVPESVDGRVELDVVVGGNAWLERLLLRLGPDVRVIDPPELRNLASDAAARILLRYEDTSNNQDT
jgi:proteasome accessory factor C